MWQWGGGNVTKYDYLWMMGPLWDQGNITLYGGRPCRVVSDKSGGAQEEAGRILLKRGLLDFHATLSSNYS